MPPPRVPHTRMASVKAVVAGPGRRLSPRSENDVAADLSAEALRHAGGIERIYMKRSLRNGERYSVLIALIATLILILQR